MQFSLFHHVKITKNKKFDAVTIIFFCYNSILKKTLYNLYLSFFKILFQ